MTMERKIRKKGEKAKILVWRRSIKRARVQAHRDPLD